jgi:3-phosphoshikimate 1-carboxyvinyltransferase
MTPGRRGIVDQLVSMGASLNILREVSEGGEPVADILVKSSPLQGGKISGDQIPGIIDEIPILAILGSQTETGLEIRDAGELRVKESDRIRSVVENLHRMGGVVEEYPDGFKVEGQQTLHGSRISSFGDHRIAMSFAVAGLLAEGRTIIEEAECAAVSFPDFYKTLREISR